MEDQEEKLQLKVQALISEGKPVYLQFGFGNNVKQNFLNIDSRRYWFHDEVTRERENVFVYDWLDQPLPIADHSVDFIFHEDFIEHINQEQQIKFLAETYRILKPGCYHRVNTPSLSHVLKLCEKGKGLSGVYDEWKRWSHQLLLTREYLKEVSYAIGYYEVAFLEKNITDSGVNFGGDTRPDIDRDAISGNIIAELRK